MDDGPGSARDDRNLLFLRPHLLKAFPIDVCVCTQRANKRMAVVTTTKATGSEKHQANNAEENSVVVVVVHRVLRALSARATTLKSSGYW